jgi:hypothetical protein
MRALQQGCAGGLVGAIEGGPAHKRIEEPLWRRQGHRTTLLVESGRTGKGGWIGVPTEILRAESCKAALEAMEARLMRRINDNHQALLGEVRNLRSEHSVTRDLVTKLPATVRGAIEQPLLRRITDLEDRVSKIEEKPRGSTP